MNFLVPSSLSTLITKCFLLVFLIFCIGDVFYADWDSLFNGVTAVISTLGGFGNNEEMERLNGEANVLAINAAKNLGIVMFVCVCVYVHC